MQHRFEPLGSSATRGAQAVLFAFSLLGAVAAAAAIATAGPGNGLVQPAPAQAAAAPAIERVTLPTVVITARRAEGTRVAGDWVRPVAADSATVTLRP